MKSNINKYIPIILILTGCFLILLPKINSYYYEKKQKMILDEILETKREDTQSNNTYKQENEVSEEDILNDKNNLEEVLPSEVVEEDENTDELQEKKNNDIKNLPVEGILQIDKIDLLMPVIEGATLEHLNISISSLKETGKPWEKNNYAIAGHRSRTYGKHFNRLDELELGDEIIFTDLENNQYIFTVNSKEIVDETDFSILENRGISEITLITCDPIYEDHPTTRLIVKGIKNE